MDVKRRATRGSAGADRLAPHAGDVPPGATGAAPAPAAATTPDHPAAVAPATPDGGGDVNALARGGLANLVGALVSAIANFALVVVVARYLDPTAAGIFFGATSLFLILETLLRLGGDVGAVYFVARWHALGKDRRIVPGLYAAFAPVALLGVLVAVAMIVLAPRLADVIGDGHHSSLGLLRQLAVVLPVAAVYDIALGVTRGFARMRPTVLVEKIARPVLQVVLVAVVLAAGWNGGLGPSWAVPYLACAAAAVLTLRAVLRAHATSRPDLATVRAAGREFWAFTLPRAVAGVAQILLQRLDIVLVAALRGPKDAAIYTAATRFLVVGQFVSQAMAAPVQPRLSAALAAGDRVRARALYRVSTTWIVLLSWPVFLSVAMFASVYVGLFGPGYRAGSVVVVILAGSMLVAGAVGVVDSVIIMAGRTSWNLATTLGALIVNVVLDLALIPHLGIVGAAIGWCGAILASNVLPLLVAWRGLDLHPFGGAALFACLVAAVCFGLLPGAGYALSRAGAFAGLALGCVVYAIALWRWRERFDLVSFLRMRRVRAAAAS